MEDNSHKTRVHPYISRTVDERFRQMIMQKYHRYEKGFYSYEVEMALRHWLALHTNTQTLIGTGHPNPTPRIVTVFNLVKEWLLTHYYFEIQTGQQIALAHIKEAIMNVQGSDPRTVKKWIKTFHKMGLIKPSAGSSWEMM